VKRLAQKPLLLIVLMVYLVFTAFFAENFICPHLDHDHDRDGAGGCCSVCYEIELAQVLLEGLGRIGIILCAACLITYTKERIKKPALLYLMVLTSIALKVRLNT
jgi:hypothetical protein